MEISLSDLASLVGGRILSNGAGDKITGLASLSEAKRGELSFFALERYLPALKTTKASAVLVPQDFSGSAPDSAALIGVPDPSLAFAAVVTRYAVPPRQFRAGVHPSAVVHETAQLDPAAVSIGSHVVVEAGAKIGAGTEIGAGGFIGENCVVGENTLFHPRVTLLRACTVGSRCILHSGVVIGSDGFGFQNVGGRHQKIDQVGIVQIDDDVEIGGNTVIDRARFGRTWIGEGTKIDNLVQIAHNVVVGKHCIIVAQAGLAGSCRLADNVIIAAQAGIGGHIELGSGVVITAQSGIGKSVSTPGAYMGYHALPIKEMMRVLAATRKLPELVERVRQLEKADTPTD